jgi:hypothetical protein
MTMTTPSSDAIGASSELLRSRLSAALNNLTVKVGRPESSAGGTRALNLFLYQVSLDPSLRNEPLDRGQLPPLWLCLHYLLTAFDDSGESDSEDAHRLLGQGMAVLQGLNFIKPPSNNLALAKNPETLKVSFDEANVDLLSKLMQGSDEKYRVSAALQVRPVMVALDSPPSYAPLVKSIGPPASPGIVVLPSLGARLTKIDPARFVAGQAVTVTGTDFAGYDQVVLGSDTFPFTPGAEGVGTFAVPAASTVAANGYGLCLQRTLPTGRTITSDALLAELMPTVATVALNGALTQLPPAGPLALRHGRFQVTGTQLGGATVSVFASLFRDGVAHGLYPAAATSTSTQLDFTVLPEGALPPGNYALVLRVNGQQAIDSPTLNWL